ncbi:MAG: hypothetical protein RLZ04_68 [Actinomycetota bacterium]|jgi:hypothetical protein
MRLRSRRVLLGTALAMMAAPFATSLPTTPVSAAAGDISNINHAAPLQNLYDHSTGGGYYNDGSTTYVKNELQGEDFACGDRVTFLAYFETAADPVAAEPFSVTLTQEFTTDSTGQSGVALFPIADSPRVNTSDPALVPATPTASVPAVGVVTASGTAFTSGATESITYTVTGLYANQKIVTRVDATIGCQYEATPTGNLQASLTSALVLDPPNGPEEAGSGAQTINFRNVNNLTNLGEPVLDVAKSVMTADGTCGVDDAPGISVPVGAPVTYCYTVTNSGNGPAIDVTLVDDMATPADDSDDVTLTLVGLTDEDSDTDADDLGDGSATATLTGVSFDSEGTFTNTVTASATGTTASATAEAEVTTEPSLTIVKSRIGSGTVYLGDTITYQIVLANVSSTLFLDPAITDANAEIGTCELSITTDVHTEIDGVPFSPGQTYTCSATHVVTEADVEAGEVVNTAVGQATFEGTELGIDSNEIVVPVGRPEEPQISLTKTRIGDEAVTLGDDITYEIVATNDSAGLTIDDVTILDDNAVITGCDQEMPASLAPGESLTCTAVHTVTEADIAAGEVINVATVDGYEATTDSNLDGVASNAVVVVLAAMPVTGSSDGLVTLALFVFGLGILVAVYSRRETLA